jgi:hypothetical protein
MIGPANAASADVEATATADYELVAPAPTQDGLYKVFDLESGVVCYMFRTNTAYDRNVAVSCVPDTRPDSHFPGTRP